jgi:hypothetical protein
VGPVRRRLRRSGDGGDQLREGNVPWLGQKLAELHRLATLSSDARPGPERLGSASVDLRALNRGEVIATIGGLVFGLSLLLAWYHLHNQFAHLNSCHGPDVSCSGWHSLTILRYLFVLGAVAPLILSWIIVRGHALAWPRGEMTAVVAVVALVLTLFRGLIDKPGSPNEEISLDFGWWVALVGTLLMLAGAVLRSQESAPRRKPPGVL